jgi:hypothetical protein
LAAAGLLVGAHGLTALVPGEHPLVSANNPESTNNPLPPLAGDARADAPADQPADRSRPYEHLAEKLMRPASLDKEISGAPLRDVLGLLSDKYDLTFIVDAKEFERSSGVANIEDANVRLPKMPAVSLQTVLRQLLTQLPGEGTILVRHDHLLVTTIDRYMMEVYGKQLDRLPQPLVHIVLKQRLLGIALADIALQSGRDIVLDPRVRDPEKLLVTVTLLNTPTDTAVRVLAETTNLKAVQLDNVFFVTTREFAAELQKEEDKRVKMRSRDGTGPRPPSGAPKGAGLPSP